jgi:hypothetical protein
VQVHIGAFSAGRQNVHPFCGRCKERAYKYLTSPHMGPHIVFADYHDTPAKGNSDPWLFIVDYPRSVGLNE